MLVTNGSNHDVDLDDGRVLPPGGRDDIDDTPRHRGLIDDGLLLDLSPLQTAAPKPADKAGTDTPTRGSRRAASAEEN